MSAHIIARSGWSSLEHEMAMLRYAANLSGKEKAKILFLNTASASTPEFVAGAKQKIEWIGCEFSTLDFFGSINPNYEDYINSHDVLHVGGGNTRSMLAVWREYGLDQTLRKANEQGLVLSGFSAGALCWFEQCLTDSLQGEPQVLKGLGFLKGSACPHYDSEELRAPTYIKKIKSKEILPGFALRDFTAIHFVDGKLFKAITTQEDKTPSYVDKDGEEKILATIPLLGPPVRTNSQYAPKQAPDLKP